MVWGTGATSGRCEGYIAAYSFNEKVKMRGKISDFLIVNDNNFFSRGGDSVCLLSLESFLLTLNIRALFYSRSLLMEPQVRSTSPLEPCMLGGPCSCGKEGMRTGAMP